MNLEHVTPKPNNCSSQIYSNDFIPKTPPPVADDQQIHLPQSHSNLLFIGKCLQKFSDNRLFGGKFVQEYLLTQYRRNRSISTI